MAVTVGDLLEGLRSLSQDLVDHRRGESAQRSAETDLGEWPALASATIRVLDLVPLPERWRDDNASLRAILTRVATGEAQPTAQTPRPDATEETTVLASMTVRIGVIADMLVGQPTADTTRDESAALVLLAGVLAPVHHAAQSTLHSIGNQHDSDAAWLLQRVATHTEGFARIGGYVRGGRYADLIAIPPGEDSLEAALATWQRVSHQVLALRRGATGLAMQTVAGDLMILTAAAAHTVHAAETLGIVPPEPDRLTTKTLTDAHTHWRELAAWPTFVRLDGLRTPDHEDASRTLRRHITTLLRDGRDWAVPDVIANRADPTALLSTMRRALHTGTAVAASHERALTQLVHNGGQLWIAALALGLPQHHGGEVYQARNRRRWLPMPAGEAHGLELLQQAQNATRLTERAGTFLDYTTPLARSVNRGRTGTAPSETPLPHAAPEPASVEWEIVEAAPVSAAHRRPIPWQSHTPASPSLSR